MNGILAFQAANILDVALVLLLVVFGFIGAKKGFVHCIFGLISTIVALIIAFALAKTLAGSLGGIKTALSGKLETSFLKIRGFDADISGEGLAAALESVNLPSFIKSAITKQLGAVNDLPVGTTLASRTAPVVAQYILLLICGIVIFIVAKLLLKIIEKLLTKLVNSIALVAALNGLLGFVVGVIKMLLFVCAVLAILSLIPSEGLTKFFDETTILKIFYHDNLINRLLGLFIKS